MTRRSRTAESTWIVTGAGRPLAERVAQQLSLAAAGDVTVQLLPTDELTRAPAGVRALIHLDADASARLDPVARRQATVDTAAAALLTGQRLGVPVVLVTSTLVVGPQEPGLLVDEAAPAADSEEDSALADLVAVERLARQASGVTVLRPAVLVGPGADGPLTGYFDAPRLLTVRGGQARWQLCHVGDLAAAIAAVLRASVSPTDGQPTICAVASAGSLDQEQVEQITGRRSLDMPAAVATATAQRLRRLGLTAAPASELDFLSGPVVTEPRTLTALGWAPAYRNEDALADHISLLGTSAAGASSRRLEAARTAAGAAVAVAGTVALTRRMARRRRAT